MGVEGVGKQWMKLSLGLGVGGPTRGEISSESMATTRSDASERSSRGRNRGGGFYGFTRAQLEELSLQLLFFNKYLTSAQTALPPPFQLLLPIFTSLPSSFHHSSFHLLLHYPLFALQQQQQQQPPPTPPCLDFGHPGLDQRERMDQPGRCRRTDGKRWRCTKEVVPNEKYCEKHMHRGCGRSRKLVESSMEKPSSSSQPSNVLNLNSVDSVCPDLNTSNVPQDSKLEMQPSVGVVASNSNKTIKDNGGKDQKIEDPKERKGNDGVIKIAFKLASSAFTNGKMEITEKEHKLGKDNGCVYERVKEEKIIAEEKLLSAGNDDKCSNGKVKAERSETETRNNKSKKSDAVGLEFSPKSVLQEVSTVSQNNTHSVVGDDFEHMRCRRTDGKRWRCRKEVIAEDQKYCAKHMHRGAKKRLVGSQGAECGEKINPFALVKRANKLVVGFDSNLKS